MRGQLRQWLRRPALIRPFDYRDPKTGQVVSLRTSSRYAVLTIDERAFYFFRESGRFDGIGQMAIDDPNALTYSRAETMRRLARSHARGGSPR